MPRQLFFFKFTKAWKFHIVSSLSFPSCNENLNSWENYLREETIWGNTVFWQKTLFLIHFVATSYRQKGKKHGLCSHLNPNFLLTDIIFIFFYMLILFPIGFAIVHSRAILDVLCCQQIKLFQVVSTSEFHEYWWNDLENIFWFLRLSAGPQKLEHKIDHNYFTV